MRCKPFLPLCIIAPVIVVILLNSCSSYRYIYSASPPNNPYFTGKGDSKLTAYYSEGDNSDQLSGEKDDGFDVQGAYAMGNRWAVTTSYFHRRERDIYTFNSNNIFDSSRVNYKRNLVDVGGGYFMPVNFKKTITFNLYGGLALGKFSIKDNGVSNGANYSRYHNSAITKWFFQPSVNFMPGKYFHFSIALKNSFVHYGNIQTSYTAEELKYFSLDKIANKTLPYLETSFDFQLGLPEYPWVKLDAAISGASQPYGGNGSIAEEPRLRTRGFNGSIGLNFDFSKIKKMR